MGLHQGFLGVMEAYFEKSHGKQKLYSYIYRGSRRSLGTSHRPSRRSREGETVATPPGSSAHGIFQARVLEWGAIAKSHQSQRRKQTLGKNLQVLQNLPCKQALPQQSWSSPSTAKDHRGAVLLCILAVVQRRCCLLMSVGGRDRVYIHKIVLANALKASLPPGQSVTP